MLNLSDIRNQFPILNQKVHGHQLVYFDNAATTQKPQAVLDTLNRVYRETYSNIHRGVHYLSEQSTEEYENVRKIVQEFLHAARPEEIVFTSGTTGGINEVAFSFGEKYVNRGDEIIVSEMEHHSNIVPWQMLCQRKGALLRVIPFRDPGILDLEAFQKLLNEKTRIVAVAHASNTLGTVNPVKEIVQMAHARNIPVLVDGAQAVQHLPVDVQYLDCDFYVFSGHKIYGPTGTGVLYGKEKWLEELPPWQGGGEMVECVHFDHTDYAEVPLKFEAGTPNIAGVIGLGEALRFLQKTGWDDIRRHEEELGRYARAKLSEIEGIRFFGDAPGKIAIFSFLVRNLHPYDTGMILDKLGIAVRTGMHCAQPVMDHYGIEGTVRASLVFYNTTEEVDRLCEGIRKAITVLSR